MTVPQSHAEWQRRAAGLRYSTGHFIDGEHVAGRSGRHFTIVNPATAQPLCEMAAADAADVDAAVASALRNHRSGAWRTLAPRDRLQILYRLADLIDQHTTEFALLDTLCMGKPVRDMVAVDVPQSSLTFRYFAELSDKVEGTVTATASDAFHYTLREPLGVVGCITPWNYPLMQIAWKIAPAIAAGNTVVLKAAEQAPLSALLLAELFVRAGAPPGTLNVVSGTGADAGAPLALHADVAKISFTGSTVTGKKMLVYAGQSNMKRVSLECGGKSPQIFLADLEDLDRAVTYAINGIFSVMGEVCSAGSRLLVDRPIAEAFIAKFMERGPAAYVPGDPLDPATTMGPLVTQAQHRKVLGYIEQGRAEGATLAFGGDTPDLPGFYVNSTLFTGVRNDMTIAREEIFGPVATIIEVDGLEDALRVANDTVYGLQASVWTSDLRSAHEAVRGLEAGTLYVNCYEHGDSTMPFLGHKQSGQGGDKTLEGLLNYTQTKAAWIHLGR
jgi:gamma-glutamyl-gamma-aminobutyraldehyde dehydrogenase